MFSRRVAAAVGRECRGLTSFLPFLGLALILAVIVGPPLTLLASGRFQSPASPVSPIRRPPTVPRPGAVATAKLTASPAVRSTVQPRATATSQPAPTAEAPEVATPPPPPPVVGQSEATTPPTLWIVAGLLVVGAIVAALLFFRKA
jgi:hypothetical protein